jgi:hypothetical protein
MGLQVGGNKPLQEIMMKRVTFSMHTCILVHVQAHACTPQPSPIQRAQVLAELELLCGALPVDSRAWTGHRQCVACMAAPRSTRLRPCCHALLCTQCAAELVRRGDNCPACRAAVEQVEEGGFDSTFAPA